MNEDWEVYFQYDQGTARKPPKSRYMKRTVQTKHITESVQQYQVFPVKPHNLARIAS